MEKLKNRINIFNTFKNEMYLAPSFVWSRSLTQGCLSMIRDLNERMTLD